ncbi:MAG TPA: hypothetical protein PKH77_17465 [Anaerolineae bacterium]|nr:hypothetical protein [Anaerolineae bacterium]
MKLKSLCYYIHTQRQYARIFFSLIVLWVAGFVIYATYGFTWSFEEMKYRRWLRRLPTPPGWEAQTDLIDTNAYGVPLYGYRYYDVYGQVIEIVTFFQENFPESRWKLWQTREYPLNSQQGNFLKSVVLLFAHPEQHCCLEVSLVVTVDENGIQGKERIPVHITLADETCADYVKH